MKLNISRLTDEMRKGVERVAPLLEITLDYTGVEMQAEKGEQFSVTYDGKCAEITYTHLSEFYRGLRLLKQYAYKKSFSEDRTCEFKELGVMIDCSRNAVKNLDAIKRMIGLMALMGYNQLMLYTEDTYELENEPYFGYLRGRYTPAELREIDEYASDFGIELVPCVQTLAHLNCIFRWPDYRAINDVNDIMLAGDEKTYALIDKIFSALSKSVKSRKINIGMDEAHLIGLGKYLDKNGYENRSEIMLKHLNKVVEIADKYGFTCRMWSDMFFRLAYHGEYYTGDKEGHISQEVIDLVPKNLELIFWDYYHTDEAQYDNMLKRHAEFKNKVLFAGGAWEWIGFTPANKYSIKASEAALAACKANGTDSYLVTMWGDNGAEASMFSVLPTLVTISETAYGAKDKEEIGQAFKALTDMNFDSFMAVDSANIVDEYLEANVYNPSKYMLYNDLFLGIFDPIVKEGDGAVYTKHIKKLKSVEKAAGQYEGIFATQRALCEVLELKYELGVMTRNAYNTHDPKAAKKLVSTHYKPLIKKLEGFYEIFREQWYSENKPEGFEVQDARIGGLIMRVKNCMRTLEDYASGKIAKIPELEVKLINPNGREEINKKPINFNDYGKNITTSVM